MKTSIQNLFIALALLALPALVQAQFTFTTNNGAITITGYNPTAGPNMVIPAATNGYPVTAIGDLAFYFDGNITNVVIPNSISSIGDDAFALCSSLTSVTIPNSVTNIGAVAFGVCSNLAAITVDPQNPVFSSVNGVLCDKSQATLLQFPGGLGGGYTIPSSVTSIAANAFEYCSSLASVAIPNSVTNIGHSAFLGCVSLTGVTIPNSVTSIGAHAFTACSSLTSVTIPNSVTSIGADAFYSCSSLTSVTIPNSVTSIGDHAFAGSGLTSVTIPNSVTSIGDGVFASCLSLTNVTIPNSVTNIGDHAFYYSTNLTSVTIPNSVTSIGAYVFDGSGITSVTIPNSVTSIANMAFADCASLTSAFFLGNAPPDVGTAFSGDPATVYYLAGTTGWGSTFGSVPAVFWNPQATAMSITGGQFGFTLTGPSNVVIVVEACTDLAHPVWLPVSTNTLSALGTSAFSDPQSTGYPMRYYRFRSP